MKFSYVAIGTDNQKLTGNLEAKSLEVARSQLHKMNLSIIALNEDDGLAPKISTARASGELKPLASEIKSDGEMATFYFVANDSQEKEVNGTIDATDAYLAYKRLITDYQFRVVELALYAADGHHGSSLAGNFDAWNQALNQEGVLVNHLKTAFVKNETEEQAREMDDEVATEIDAFIQKTKNLITEHREVYSKSFLAEIEKMLGNLERIKSSNNLNHITKVCKDLYQLVSHPDLPEVGASGQKNASAQMMIDELKKNSFISSDSLFSPPQKNKTGFGGIRSLFGKIDHQLNQSQGPLDTPVSKAPTQMALIKAHISTVLERNPILKQAKRQAYEKLLRQAKAFEAQKSIAQARSGTGESRDFTGFFIEVDSFVGWLLFFYLAYFFVASFSLERNFGLSQALVVKTFSSPFIINAFLFLLFTHLLLTLKMRLFRQNLLGSLFLFFLGYGAYGLIVSNF